MKDIQIRAVDKARSTSLLDWISASLWAAWDFALAVLLGGALITLILLDMDVLPGFWAPLRILLGLAFVLFVPGYTLQAALFPNRTDLDGPERLGLSFGLSVAIIPVLALLLDKLPWGIRLWPIVLSIAMVTMVFSLASVARRLHLPPEERFTPAASVDLPGWWSAQDRTDRRLYAVLAGALGLALLSALTILLLPKPGERFTEFYMLGAQGMAENYPREVSAGQAISVTVGIRNQEGVAASYRVEARDGQGVIGQAGPISLKPGEKFEGALVFTPLQTGNDVLVTFALYRDDQASPYRTLKLWLKVKPAS